jgi:hypothetical protein
LDIVAGCSGPSNHTVTGSLLLLELDDNGLGNSITAATTHLSR